MQPTIIIRGSHCSVVGIPPEVNEQLEEEFSYHVLGYEYTNAYKNEEWTGKQYVYRNRHFSVGLLHDVVSSLRQKGIETVTKDFRNLGQKLTISDSIIQLRPYQKEIVDKAIEFKNSSIEVATGGGKTLIAAEYIRRLGLKSLVIVPSIEILKQMESQLSSHLSYPIGIIGDKEHDPEFVTVSTWQSLGPEYQEYLTSVDCIVIDEAQHIGAKILRQIARDIPAIYRLGMSGTLWREDGADLEIIAATGPKIASMGYSQLIDQDYLVPARIWIIKIPTKYYTRWSTYNDVYKDYILTNSFRNEAIINISDSLVRQGRKVLVFVTRIEHGEQLAKMGGHDFVYAYHPDRRELINDFRDGKIKCLISTSVLQEGFDLPPVDALVLAAPAKSIIVTLQRIGRALRPYENKKDAIVVDFIDNCKYLRKHFDRRMERYKAETSWKIEKMANDEIEPVQEKIDDDW